MARLLYGRPGHGRSGCWELLAAVGAGQLLLLHSGGAVEKEGREFLRGGKVSEARHEKESCQAKLAWGASCIYLAVRIRPPSALTSSPTIVDGVRTYV